MHQFIDRLVVLVVSETGTHSAFSKTVETPLVQFLDWLMPVVQRQVQMAQTVQKIVELPQVQLLRSCGRLCAHAETSSRVSRQVAIVASRATDHGGNRESEQLLRVGADRGVVPQIMEEIVKVNSFYELEQIVASCHRSWRKS